MGEAEVLPGGGRRRLITVLLALAGLAAVTAVVGAYGFRSVGRALLAVGWDGFLLFAAWHLGTFTLLGVAWWAVAPGGHLPGLVWGRVIRDSAAEVLPVSQIGGFVLGARAAAVAGLPAAQAFASTVVDVTTEMLAEILYTGLGLALLLQYAPGFSLEGPVLVGLGIAVLLAGGFILAQRRGFGAVERLGYRVAGRWLPSAAAVNLPLQRELLAIHGRPGRWWGGTALHLIAWLALAGEGWLGLHLLGAPRGVGVAVALESLVYAIRSVGFAVPNALGVQEGAYLAVGSALGLAPETVLALSLLKRARDVAIGLPALLTWQAAEAWRARRRAAMPGGPGPT